MINELNYFSKLFKCDYKISIVTSLVDDTLGMQYPDEKIIEINANTLDDRILVFSVLSHEIGHCKTYSRRQFLREFYANVWAIKQLECIRQCSDEFDFKSIRNRLILSFLLWENDLPARFKRSANFARKCGILSHLEQCLISNLDCDVDRLDSLVKLHGQI